MSDEDDFDRELWMRDVRRMAGAMGVLFLLAVVLLALFRLDNISTPWTLIAIMLLSGVNLWGVAIRGAQWYRGVLGGFLMTGAVGLVFIVSGVWALVQGDILLALIALIPGGCIAAFGVVPVVLKVMEGGAMDLMEWPEGRIVDLILPDGMSLDDVLLGMKVALLIQSVETRVRLEISESSLERWRIFTIVFGALLCAIGLAGLLAGLAIALRGGHRRRDGRAHNGVARRNVDEIASRCTVCRGRGARPTHPQHRGSAVGAGHPCSLGGDRPVPPLGSAGVGWPRNQPLRVLLQADFGVLHTASS